jgi:hypothetical protein
MKRKVEECLKDTLAKNHLCYVLITCDKPSIDGELKVEMTYEGDVSLASYLLHGAQDFIDDQQNSLPENSSLKIHKLD